MNEIDSKPGDKFYLLTHSELNELVDEYVKAEREACAKVCEDEGSVDDLPEHYAAAIRARGQQ